MIRFKSLLLSGAAALVLVPAAAAQTPATAAPAAPAAEAEEEVVVTGSRRPGRTLATSAVPVDVITAETLTEQGFTEVNRALNLTVPSFNFPQPSITDGTDVIRPATLRGLAPDQTLVLLNGKRRHVTALLNINGSVGRGSPAVDMNLFPMLAIERIEVLRDGAAAQYGSDAIAGVINVRLKRASQGGSASITYGAYNTTLDGVAQITGLQTIAGGQPATFAGDGTYLPITAGEREVTDGHTLTTAMNFGMSLGQGGFLNVTLEYRGRDRTNRAGADPRRQYALVGGLADAREFTFNRYSHNYGDAETKDFNLILNAGLPVEAIGGEFYATMTYGQRTGASNGFYRIASDARNLLPVYPDGFLPQIDTDMEDLALTGGFKGIVGAWNWDLSLGLGTNGFDFGVSNSLNASLGPASPTRFDAGGLGFTQMLANFDVQRDYDMGLATPLSVAFGLEYRREVYEIKAGETASWVQGSFVRLANGAFQDVPFNQALPAGATRLAAGAQVFPGFRNSIEEARHNWSAYLDLEADITAWWNVTAAVRYENYSDFGSDWNWKLATRVEATNWLAFRGAASTGFRAPSLHQQYFQTIATNNVGGVLLEILTVPVDSPIAQALGSRPLKAEKSENLSLGFVLTPDPAFTLTVDAYQIKIDDRIVVSENIGATGNTPQAIAVRNLLTNAGFPQVSSARFFVNGIDTTTQGIDAIATYRLDTERFGRFNFTLAYNYNKTEIDQVLAAPGPLAQIPGLTIFGRQEILRTERGQPKDKVILAADWQMDGFSLNLKTTRFGEVFSPGTQLPPAGSPIDTLWGDDVILSPKWITDLEAGYEFYDGKAKIAVGANNLFDVYPDRLPTGARPAAVGGGVYSVNNYFLPYSVFSPFGFNGRFVYARLSYSF